MADITIVNGVYKPTYNWGAPSCMEVHSMVGHIGLAWLEVMVSGQDSLVAQEKLTACGCHKMGGEPTMGIPLISWGYHGRAQHLIFEFVQQWRLPQIFTRS
jgi:hypothetical protein